VGEADVNGPDEDNFTPLTSLDWQVHVYGDAAPEIRSACDERKLPLHAFPWRPEMGRTGLRRNAVYLVRPDGYVPWRILRAAPRRSPHLDARKLSPTGRPKPHGRLRVSAGCRSRGPSR